MHKSAKLKKVDTKTCDPIPVIKKIPLTDIVPTVKVLAEGVDKLRDSILYKGRGFRPEKASPLIYADFKKSKDFMDFLNQAFNVGLGDLKPKEEKLKRKFYRQLKNLTKQKYVIYKKSFTKKPCSYSVQTVLEVKKWEPHFDTKTKRWSLPMEMVATTKISVNCSCDKNDNTQLKSATVYYSGNINTIVDFYYYELKFVEAKKPNYKAMVTEYQCCQTKSTEDGSFMDPNQNESISLPDGFINASAGLGFDQEFEEISWFIGGGYTRNVADIKESPLFVGAGASFGKTTFNDSSSSNFEVGPMIELFTPITTGQGVHWVNGIQGNFFTGNEENFGVKDKVSGIQIGFETGLNVMLGQNLAVGVVLPIATWQTTTTKPDGGGEKFTSDETTLLINKDNPVQLKVRFGF